MVLSRWLDGMFIILSTLLDTIHLLNGCWMVIDLLNGWTGGDLEGGGGLWGLTNRRGAALACKRQLLGSLRTKTVRSNAGNRPAQSPVFAYLSRLQARLRY